MYGMDCGAERANTAVSAYLQEERSKRMSELMLEVDALEGKLQEASKQRESRLRKVRPKPLA